MSAALPERRRPARSDRRRAGPAVGVDRTAAARQDAGLPEVEASSIAAGWEIEYQHLDHDPNRSSSIESELAETSILFERHGAPIECVGASPPTSVTLLLPEQPDALILNGIGLGPGEVAVLGPGTEVGAVTRGAINAWNIHIPTERFLAARSALGCDPGGFRADRPAFEVVRSRIEASRLSMLPLGIDAARSSVAESEAAADLITDAVTSSEGPSRSRAPARCDERAVRAARDYIRAHLDAPIRIPDVCRAAGVGQRTLERRFRLTYGMTPKAYVRVSRLNAAHRTLTDPKTCAASVMDVAVQFGFTHLGRFASEYRALFGCLPSESRRNRRATHD